MGYDFYFSHVVVGDDVRIDWDAALRVIERIELRDVYLDETFGWEAVEVEDNAFPPEALGVYQNVRYARSVLVDDLHMLREALLATTSTGAFVLIETPGNRVFMSGLGSWGHEAPYVHNPLYRLADVGALAAAGFVGWANSQPGHWHDPSSLVRRRRAAAGRAALHAEDDAQRLIRHDRGLTRLTAMALHGRLASACDDAGAVARQADADWQRTRRRPPPKGTAIGVFLAALMRCAAEIVLWTSTVEIPGGRRTPTPSAAIARKCADVVDGMPLSRRSRLTLPSEWHLELRACVADSAVYAQYLDGVLAPDRSRELEETTLWANLRVEANVYIRNLLALCIEALGYLSPKGLDSFREHTDLAELTPSPSEGDSSGYATEDLAVVGIADDTELDWDRAHDAAATQGLTDEIAALQTGLDGFRLDLNWVDVPGGVLAVFAERGNDGTQWQQVVTQLRDAGVLDELGATLASPHPRSMPR